jgi:LacI family transcriptional regulator
MRDVAALAGVGTMTVSRVINGSVEYFTAIEALKYRPNQIARSLRGQRSRQIGIILPKLQDSFFAACAEEINLVA